MDTIQIKDKRFTTFIPEERILREVTGWRAAGFFGPLWGLRLR